VTADVYPDLRQARITKSIFTKGDIAIILTPNDAHFDIAMECISKGMHVMITKPIVQNLKDHILLAKKAIEKTDGHGGQHHIDCNLAEYE
jgi:D-galacturonate reductase